LFANVYEDIIVHLCVLAFSGDCIVEQKEFSASVYEEYFFISCFFAVFGD